MKSTDKISSERGFFWNVSNKIQWLCRLEDAVCAKQRLCGSAGKSAILLIFTFENFQITLINEPFGKSQLAVYIEGGVMCPQCF